MILREDPGERNNLAEDYPGKLEEMLSKMDNAYRALGDLPPPLRMRSPYPNEDCRIDIYLPRQLNDLYPGFSNDCLYYGNFDGPMFMDLENNYFRIAAGFPGIGAATKILLTLLM